MQVKDLIYRLQLLPQDLEIYSSEPQETGGYTPLDNDPQVITMVECKAQVEQELHEGQEFGHRDPMEYTYIDKIEYHIDDPSVIRVFKAVGIGV